MRQIGQRFFQPLRRVTATYSKALNACLVMAVVLSFAALTGCDRASVERRYHANGKLAEEMAYLTDDQGHRVRHGLGVSWHPNGIRSHLQAFNRGKPVGYAIAWDEQGRLLERHPMRASRHGDLAVQAPLSHR
jgi:hypothetical protein